MINIVAGKKIEKISKKNLYNLLHEYKKIVVDIGTGDGKFIYNLAKKNKKNFYIGVEPAKHQLENVSKKIKKKESRGGLNNILLIKSSIEQCSEDLFNIADEIYINFPWGSLLEGLVKVIPDVVNNIVNIANPYKNVTLHIYLTYFDLFEPSYIKKRNLPNLSREFLKTKFANKLSGYGINIKDIKIPPVDEVKKTTSWSKKILSTRAREIFYIKCSIKPRESQV